MTGPHLETPRLRLRPPEPGDLEGFAELLGDPEVMRFLGPMLARGDVPERIELYRQRWRANGFGHLTILRRDDGAFLGRVAFTLWDPDTWQPGVRPEIRDRAETELGWALLPGAWGRGYATEAAAAAREWAFASAGLERLISLVHPDNARSRAVAERLGARVERRIADSEGSELLLYVHPAQGQAPAR